MSDPAASSSHPVRQYVKRVESLDIEEYPEWDVEKPLKKLPVPDLKFTCQNYLLSAQPIISEEQYDVTKSIVDKFVEPGGEGEKLQEKLKEFADTVDNWAYDWWLNDMYMKPRFSLPLNSNPGMVFPRQNFVDQDAQLRFAARLVSGILDYKVIIDSRGLPVDRCRHREKGQPLCMEQYYRLFSTHRVPGLHRDSQVSHRVPGLHKDSQVPPGDDTDTEPEHIIVLCKNQFYVLDVVVDFTRLDHDNLFTQLKRIVRLANEEEETPPIGILTAFDRDSWATARMELMKDPDNRDGLGMIERSSFVLCLDKSIPLSWNHQSSIDETRMSIRDDVSLASQMLHGQGSKINSSNRWFDKTMQFVVGEDGNCGLCYEHSPSEGIAVVQLIEHLLKYMEEVRRCKLPRMQSLCELPYPRKISWKTSSTIQTEMTRAAEGFNKAMENIDLFVLRFNKFGREFPKTQNMSPDSFIQLALQLTYYKVHGKLVSTYESASTRRFRLGRVDNIRSASNEALEWVKAMIGETEVEDAEKMVLLRKAMKRQTEIMVQTILGNGTDCHLLGLKELSQELGQPMPKVFTDPTYSTMNHFTLSTSQVPTTMDAFMCYGPVVPDGYGVCYNPHTGYILVCVTSFHSSPETSSDFFALTLEGSFLQMYELCLKTNETSPYKIANGEKPVNNNDLKMRSPAKSKLTRQSEVEKKSTDETS